MKAQIAQLAFLGVETAANFLILHRHHLRSRLSKLLQDLVALVRVHSAHRFSNYENLPAFALFKLGAGFEGRESRSPHAVVSRKADNIELGDVVLCGDGKASAMRLPRAKRGMLNRVRGL